MEDWKELEGYEHLYRISTDGEIYSMVSKRVLTSQLMGGYYRIKLYKDRIGKFHRMHRLVANAFLDNPRDYKYIKHKDGDKSNNKVSNLEWVSYSDLLKDKKNEKN